MNQAVEAFNQQINLSRALGTVALTGLKALISAQFDHAQSLAERNSNRVRNALSKSGEPRELSRLPELMQEWIGGANILVRDEISSGIDYQLEVLRLVQQQAAETREALASGAHGSAGNRRAAKNATA